MRHLPFGISVVAALLWIVGFSLFGKRLGVPTPSEFQQHSGALRRLSLQQYACLYGALGWGMAMFIASLVEDYFQGRLPSNLIGSAGRVAFEIVIYVAAGCLFGWMLWGGNRKEA